MIFTNLIPFDTENGIGFFSFYVRALKQSFLICIIFAETNE